LVKYAEVQSGLVIVDFSKRHLDQVMMTLASKIAPIGRYFIISERRKDETGILADKISQLQLTEVISLLEVEDKSISLPNRSVDLVLSLFRLNEQEYEWIIPEMKRILKPTGKAVIVDMESVTNNAIVEQWIQFMFQAKIGLNRDNLQAFLAKYQLQIKDEHCKQGLIYLVISPKIPYEVVNLQNISAFLPPLSLPKTWQLSHVLLNIYEKLLSVALSDGQITDKEYTLIHKIMLNLQEYAKTFEEAIIAGHISKKRKVQLIDASKKILQEAFATAIADKILEEEEEKILLKLDEILKELLEFENSD
jgi:hypothetical protein